METSSRSASWGIRQAVSGLGRASRNRARPGKPLTAKPCPAPKLGIVDILAIFCPPLDDGMEAAVHRIPLSVGCAKVLLSDGLRVQL